MALAEQLELELPVECPHSFGLPVRDGRGSQGFRLTCHHCGVTWPAHSKGAAAELYWTWRP